MKVLKHDFGVGGQSTVKIFFVYPIDTTEQHIWSSAVLKTKKIVVQCSTTKALNRAGHTLSHLECWLVFFLHFSS